jgi:hypothetical protein
MAVTKLPPPLTNPQLATAPDHTIVVLVRKVGGKYVADPERVRVPEGRCANVVFVLENAPREAQLIKMVIQETTPESQSVLPSPFSMPGEKRVLLVTDDNSKAVHHRRKFDYVLEVREGNEVFVVDPGIDHDPPG